MAELLLEPQGTRDRRFPRILKTSALAVEIGRRLEQDWDAITDEIGLPLKWSRTSDGKVQVAASIAVPDLQGSTTREDQIAWFRTTINAFVNALRPRIAALADELTSGAGGAAKRVRASENV